MIYTAGETVFDIIFKGLNSVSGCAGGAMLNTSVSLGRLNADISFISEVGNDIVGEQILNFLNNNGIKTKFIKQVDNKAILALAFLDKNDNADYSFYAMPRKVKFSLNYPDFTGNDIFLIGSFFAISTITENGVKDLFELAHKNDTLIYYDPNFRKPHYHQLNELKPKIISNISNADIIRGSHEDFNLIFDVDSSDEVYEIINKQGNKILIYTKDSEYVDVLTETFNKRYLVSPVKTVSTIGAGDTFNAGVAYILDKLKIRKHNISTLSESEWDKIIPFAIKIASFVCTQKDNYISKEFAEEIKW